jgi:hypothetical protein
MTMSGMKRGPFDWKGFWLGMLTLAVMGGALAGVIALCR